MLDNLGNILTRMIISLYITIIIFVPLGIWKLIDIIIWLVKHINIQVN